jgi:hypothetical protein
MIGAASAAVWQSSFVGAHHPASQITAGKTRLRYRENSDGVANANPTCLTMHHGDGGPKVAVHP